MSVRPNPDQRDSDGDGKGDVCDAVTAMASAGLLRAEVTGYTPRSAVFTLDYLSDISVVSRLPKLEILQIYYNSIRDISALAHLRNLNHLNIGVNEITDCTPLSQLGSLNSLDFASNPCNLPVMSGLVNLSSLSIGSGSRPPAIRAMLTFRECVAGNKGQPLFRVTECRNPDY